MFKKIKRVIGILKNNALIDKKTSIGAETYIGRYTEVVDSKIGKYCSIAQGCRIGLYNHYLDSVTTHPFLNHKSYGFIDKDYFPQDNIDNTREDVIIGNDVYIGTNVVILRGVKIGDGAVVGAGAIVTKDVPPYAIVVGNPAKVMRYRFGNDQIEQLLKIQWWNWSKEKIQKNIKYFYKIDEFLNEFSV
ncbi:hypothetical protein CBU02nite_28000 [Clostridium butyricum]|uniref:Antibiotic acetyltransferase n=1 Tax=Clostridium butyricum TaxID=1492 RepID=A0A512TPU7_CLOBU|nr:CatB-related O-acetyltransferase [Clostridium butyricum]NOW21734.1 acetyltransferase-like isoleucine patch superfamily enzyme [Clostridium butyricum]GEQ22294.1 hypothetical protein CBU02nite_28000 [Clostridium butyricum]